MQLFTRFVWKSCFFLTLTSVYCVADLSVASDRPNIIVIMADDLGYETLGANGGTSYKTPHLDRLAGQGVRFQHCYVQPLCTPTRVQLMTGLYNVRNYVRFGYMNPTATTFGNRLRAQGYATCIAGKWQLGQQLDLPNKFGFDEHCLWQHTRRPPRYANPGLEINGTQKDFSSGEYGPDIVNDYAIDFVSRHDNKPFFLYYPMMLTHGPYQPTPDSKSWDPTAIGEAVNRAPEHFGHMVEYMDKLVGRLVAKLDELRIRDNTLIVFIGDNGTGSGTVSKMGNKEIVGAKGKTISTGMHVPLIANWPKGIKQPLVTNELADSTDILPTICEAAGLPADSLGQIDGRSFLPLLQGRSYSPRQWVYSWYSPRQSNNLEVRELVFNREFKLYRSGEFIDLRNDLLEKQPLRVGDLTGDAAQAAKSLQLALDQFTTARPADLDQPTLTETRTPAEKKGKKANRQKKKGKAAE